MYGLPLTLMFTSKYIFKDAIVVPIKVVTSINLLGVEFGMTIGMLYGGLIMIAGMLLILIGWLTLYKHKGKEIVKTGIYKYSRHPQYLGFVMVVLGWFVAWPTILTMAFCPILIWKYWNVGKTEEKEIMEKNIDYKNYSEETPFMI